MARTKKKHRAARLSKDTTIRVDHETVTFLSNVGGFPVDTIYLYDLSFDESEINYIQMVYKHFLLRHHDQYINGDMPPLPIGTKMELYLLLVLSEQIEHHSEKIRLLNDTIGSHHLLDNSNETRSFITAKLIKIIQETETSDEILEKQRIVHSEISRIGQFPFRENPHFNFNSLGIPKPLQKGIDATYKYLFFDKVLRKNIIMPDPMGTPFEIYLLLSVVDLRNYFMPLDLPEDDDKDDEAEIFDIIQTSLPNLKKYIDSVYTQCRNATSHRHTSHQLQSASIEDKIRHFRQCAIESISMKVQNKYWASGVFDDDIVKLKTAVLHSDVQSINLILRLHPHIFQPGRKNEALALAVLCTKGTEICDLLIQAGADVNYPENYPPLHQALINSDIEKCVFLAIVGASLHNGANYICECASMRPLNLPAVEFLLSRGISPSSASTHFETPIISAIKIHNSLEMCRLLIHHSVDLNCASRFGETPLALAMSIQNDNASYLMCKLLLENGANPTTPSMVIHNHGRISMTPITLARELGKRDIVHLLLDCIN